MSEGMLMESQRALAFHEERRRSAERRMPHRIVQETGAGVIRTKQQARSPTMSRAFSLKFGKKGKQALWMELAAAQENYTELGIV